MENRDKERHGEIDLAEALRLFWLRRRFILKVTGVVVLVGLAVALLSRVKYTASAIIVPQTGQTAQSGNLQGLAAIAGINLGAERQEELLSPLIYPMVTGSVPFQKDLMNTPITVNGHKEQVKLLTWFTGKGYKRFSLRDLPVRILTAIRKRAPQVSPDSLRAGIATLTPEENEGRRMLSRALSVGVNEKNGYITLSATMPQALMAAQVAARAQELLEEYITRFKLQKVQSNLDFVEARYREVKADFEERQRALANFQDANRNISSAAARARENSLENEYDLAFSIYSEMARQRELASIKVKEDTPVFTVVEPVTVPIEKSAPRRMLILAASLLIGLFSGAGLALLVPRPAGAPEVRRPKDGRGKSVKGQPNAGYHEG